jgi:ABC-type Fe3+ transport system permease subunit
VRVSARSAAAIPDRVVRHRLDREDGIRWALIALFALVLSLFLLYPLAQVLWRSLLDNRGRFIGVGNYVHYFSTPAIAASITNSLFVSASSMVVTVALAFGYAYAVTRTLMPARGFFRVAAMMPLFAPSLVQAFALIYVFGNNGIITRTGLNVGTARQGHHPCRGSTAFLTPSSSSPRPWAPPTRDSTMRRAPWGRGRSRRSSP